MNPLLSLPPSPSNIYTGKDFLTSHAVDQVEISSFCSLSMAKLLLALGICVFSDSYIALFCIRAQIMCSYPAPASQPHQIFSPATRLHCAGFTTMSRVNIPII